jgi:polysaccharide export outer membrane protein
MIAALALTIPLLATSLPGDAAAQSRYGSAPTPHTPYSHPHATPRIATPSVGRYGPVQKRDPADKPQRSKQKPSDWQALWFGQWSQPGPGSPILLNQFQRWINWEPEYTLVPGDQLDIVVGSAPELSRTLTVGPDGRVVMPMSAPIMAAGRTFSDLQAALMSELGKQLRDPRVSVTPRAYAPEQIYVGGEVGQPGTYTMPSRIGALEAIFMAGGFRPSAQAREVAILRRSPNGGMMLRTVNIRGGLKDVPTFNDTVQLRRGDIVFVPATTLSEVGQFVQSFRNTLPVDFNLSYQFGGGGGNGTTVITP